MGKKVAETLLVMTLLTIGLITLYSSNSTHAPNDPSNTKDVTPIGGGTGQIVFTCEHNATANSTWPDAVDLFTIKADRTDLQALTNDPLEEQSPRWSPDGKHIAFRYLPEEPNDQFHNMPLEVHVITAAGTSDTNLSKGFERAYYFSWSPDNRHVAFTAGNKWGQADIYVIDIDGTGLQNLTNDTRMAERLQWSPDGTRIVYESTDMLGMSNRKDLFVMNADGTHRVNLTNSEPGFVVANPIWSPDNLRIAYESFTENVWSIYVMNADGTAKTELTRADMLESLGAWSPDGKRIVFTSNRDGDGEIYVMNADGSQRTNLTNNPALDESPEWSPDSRLIVFQSNRDRPKCGMCRTLYTMKADGTDLVRLTDDCGYLSFPVWQP